MIFLIYIQELFGSDMLQELEIERPKSEYSDGPPCIETLAMNKIGEGRNNALFHYGVYAKQKWPAEWKSKLIYLMQLQWKDHCQIQRYK